MSEHGYLVVSQSPFDAIRVVSEIAIFQLESFFICSAITRFFTCVKLLFGSWEAKGAGVKVVEVFLSYYELAKLFL